MRYSALCLIYERHKRFFMHSLECRATYKTKKFSDDDKLFLSPFFVQLKVTKCAFAPQTVFICHTQKIKTKLNMIVDVLVFCVPLYVQSY